MSNHMIKIIELLNGQQLLGSVTYTPDGDYEITDPVMLIYIPEKKSIAFSPCFHFSEDKKYKIHKGVVVCVMNPAKDIATQYSAQFKGLVLPDSPKIIIPGA